MLFNISSARFSQRKIYKIFAKLTHISNQTPRWEREKKFFNFWPGFVSWSNEMRSNLIVDMANVIFFQIFRCCKFWHERSDGWLSVKSFPALVDQPDPVQCFPREFESAWDEKKLFLRQIDFDNFAITTLKLNAVNVI